MRGEPPRVGVFACDCGTNIVKTVDVKRVVDTVAEHGHLKVLDDRDLVVETETDAGYERLCRAITEQFGDQVNLERL